MQNKNIIMIQKVVHCDTFFIVQIVRIPKIGCFETF